MTKKFKKSDFCKEKVVKIDDIDAKKKLASKEEPYGLKNSFKSFTGYNDNDIIRPFYVRLPQMSGYARKFEFNSTMSFRINNKQLLKKYNQIWKRIEKLLEIKFNSKNFYGNDEKCIKKKKTYGDSVITNLHSKKMPKEKDPCKCLSIIMLGSVI